MRRVLKDFSGTEWYVDSDEHIIVKTCPNCGKPMEVQKYELSVKITHIRFLNAQGNVLGILDTDSFPRRPRRCSFCGYEDISPTGKN